MTSVFVGGRHLWLVLLNKFQRVEATIFIYVHASDRGSLAQYQLFGRYKVIGHVTFRLTNRSNMHRFAVPLRNSLTIVTLSLVEVDFGALVQFCVRCLCSRSCWNWKWGSGDLHRIGRCEGRLHWAIHTGWVRAFHHGDLFAVPNRWEYLVSLSLKSLCRAIMRRSVSIQVLKLALSYRRLVGCSRALLF